VFGSRAGESAVKFAGEHSTLDSASLDKQASDERERINKNFLRKEGGTERVFSIRKEMNETMEAGAGIYRSENSLKESCDKINELRQRFPNIIVEDRSLNFNTELTCALELDFMLDIAEAIAHSAWRRKESRGSHQRTDFPQRDDDNFLKHSLAYRTDIEPRIDYKDVIITKWPPGKRVYGKEA